MTDDIDRAQAQIDAARESAVKAAQAAVSRQGAEECRICGEPISELRRSLGATLCIYHQQVREKK